MAISVTGVIEPTLQAVEIRRSSGRPTHDLPAYDLYLRALALTFSWERDAIIRALDLLERAIERDPGYGAALVHAARCHQDLHVNNCTDHPEESRRRGIVLARRALQAAGDDPNVLSSAGYTLGYLRGNRCRDGLTRPRSEAQSELCWLLAAERLAQAVGRKVRSRD
jgi:adenylate cyclase